MKESTKQIIIFVEIIILVLSSIFVGLSAYDKITESSENTEKNNEKSIAPTVKIICNSTKGKIPLTVNFDAFVSGDDELYYYKWSFGDGETSDSKSITHTFYNEGNYLVSLRVTDNNEKTVQDNLIIEAKKNQAPTARASYDIPTYYYLRGPPTLVEFKGEGIDQDGNIVSYHWEFGPRYYPIVKYKGYFFHKKAHWYDYLFSSYESDEQNPMRVLTKPGYYWAELTITDDDGATSTDKIYITIWNFN